MIGFNNNLHEKENSWAGKNENKLRKLLGEDPFSPMWGHQKEVVVGGVSKNHTQQYGQERGSQRRGLRFIILLRYVPTDTQSAMLYQHVSQSLDILVNEYYTVAANGRIDVKEIL